MLTMNPPYTPALIPTAMHKATTAMVLSHSTPHASQNRPIAAPDEPRVLKNFLAIVLDTTLLLTRTSDEMLTGKESTNRVKYGREDVSPF